MTTDFRTELDALREQGADGTAAVKRLKALGATDSEARHAVADYLIENRRRAEAERAEKARIEAAAQQQTEESAVSNLPDTVTIETERYLKLVRSDLTFNALTRGGVDNWIGYDEIDWDVIDQEVEEVEAQIAADGVVKEK